MPRGLPPSRRRPRPSLLLLPTGTSAAQLRQVLADADRAALRPFSAGVAVVGALLVLSPQPLWVASGALVVLAGLLVGLAASARVRARHGLVPLTDEEWELSVGLQTAAADPGVLRRVEALRVAVQRQDADGRERALQDLRDEADRRGLPR